LLCSHLVEYGKELLEVLQEEIPMKYLRKLLSAQISKEKITVESIEGSTFGFRQTGMFDGCAFLILKILGIEPNFVEILLDSGIWESLCHQIGSKTSNELSPNGLTCVVRIIFFVISAGPVNNVKFLISNNLLQTLVSLLESPHLEKLADW
jgi:hypothetical protein